MARIRTVDFLPEIFQTSVNRQFLSATLDQLVQEPKFEKTQGYVGRRVGPGVNPADRYVIETTKSRNDYQLEPGVVIIDPDSSDISDVITYPGITDALKLQGATTDNSDRLYTSEYYSWDPFVDFDKLVNFSQYYWLPSGPDAVDVSATTVPLTDQFTVTRANGAYTFSGQNGTDPNITLVRGGSYEFIVAQNAKEDINFRVGNNGTAAFLIDYQSNPTVTLVRGNTYTFDLSTTGLFPFYIKTIASLGINDTYDSGVTNNGAATGTVTFVVPQDAPDTLYYACSTQFNMRGTFNIVDGQSGTGPGFWIQATPGVSGKIPATPNISSRDVLGVTNNGEDLGTVTFDVPERTAQDFYYELTNIGAVDLVTNLQFDQINNQFVVPFLEQYGGIDGIDNLDGRTIVFVNQAGSQGWEITTQFDPINAGAGNAGLTGTYDTTLFDQTTPITSLAQRYSVWQIQYVTTNDGTQYMQLSSVREVNELEKFSILFGDTYSNTQWYKDDDGYFQQIPLLTAILDTLYYQDGIDPGIVGQLRLIEQSEDTTINIDDIIGQKTYISPNGVTFTNGLKVIFRGNVYPTSYANNEYYIEGVGTSIKLLPVADFVTPETYVVDAGDSAIDTQPTQLDYLTINRASPDLNPWTRSNRWFHIDVINATAEYNNTVPVIDNNYRAKRPILEFYAGLRLFDFGTQGKQPVDIIDFSETDAFSNINGQTSYEVDGYQFVNGTRVIFAADTDSAVINKIYEVQFITPDTVSPLIEQPIINLVPASDSEVLVDQTVVCLFGDTLKGKSFYFDGLEWLATQQKIKVNQAPLFNVYDSNGISFTNKEVYPSSTFNGSKLLSYAVGGGVEDTILGFPLRYLSLTNVGDIVFDNNLYADTFIYVTDAVSKTVNISEGFTRKYSTRLDYTREIGWQPAVTPSLIRQQFRYTYDGRPLQLDIRVSDTSTVPPVQLYVNSQFIEPSLYTVERTTDTTLISLTDTYIVGDIIEVLALSDQVSKVGFYQVPINLENNPLNSNSSIFTLGTMRSHYETIGENLLTLVGPINGANNSRDLGNLVPYGLQILQQSSPMTMAGFFMRNPEYDIFAALEYNSRQYIKFKSQLLETVVRNDYNNMSIAEILDSAIAEITLGKTDINPFYWSDMLPTGSVYTESVTPITPITTNVFDTAQTYNFESANYKGLLVYLTRIVGRETTTSLLLRGYDYSVATDGPRLTITTPLVTGDVVTIREYTSTYGNFVPNTPTKLGLYPAFKPEVYLDESYVNPTLVIRGHDGSITVAFEDFRDEILLEFEKRIYDNLKLDNNPIPISESDVIPGFFRTTDYTQAEITEILSEDFLSWVGWNKLDYKSQNFIAGNAFTYNYSNAGNKLDNQPLLGAWKGIYQYFYDTETPNTTPWEMLGFSEEPSWWVERYGPAPYTSGNLVLWDDLEAGYVAHPTTPYVLEQYKRPGLTTVIPAGTEGELLSPLESIVGQYNPNAWKKSWVVGDGGPVEAAWWSSSSYPFAVMRLLALTQPAKFFSLFADRDLYKFDEELNQYLYNGRYRLDANGIQVYGNGVSKASFINWIVDYNQQLGLNSTTKLTAELQHLDVRLCYRMAAFTDKQYLRIFTERSSPNSLNSSLLLPDESYNLLLYKNQPFDSIEYSALIVEKVDNGYAVYGYSNISPYFKIFASRSNGILQTVSAGGTAVRVPKQYSNNIVQVPYGFVFTNTTMVVDFILSYGAYLESQGLVFDDVENGYTLNWNQMAQEFLYFSQQGWASGTMINLNPGATKIKAIKDGAVIDTIVSATPENMLLDQNRIVLPTRDLVIDRNENEFSITSQTNQTISYLKLKFTNYENMVVLDNVSIFNDLIYDTITAARQNRIRITAAIAADWTGQLDAQGFILNQDNVKEWEPNKKYAKGEIVNYKNTYWSAQTIVQPKLEFDYNEWVKSDYTKIQKGLLPNIANKANQLANSYNTNVANLERDNDLLSYGLIGFRPREYMQALNLDDVSQVNIYKQFLGTKGTSRSAEIFTRADLGKESGDYQIYENWGVLVATYGANANRSFFELQLNEALLQSNPGTIQVIQPQQFSEANQTVLLENVWKESYKLTSTDILPTTYITPTDVALPSAGYVNLDDVDITVFSLDDPANIEADIDNIGVGTTIWVAKSNSYNWNVYRCAQVSGQMSQLVDNLDGTSIAQFTKEHNLSPGDLIIVRYFNDAVNGVYRVLAVPSITSVVIAFSFVNTDQTMLTGEGLAFYLQSMRVSQASDVASLSYANQIIPGAKVWVDNNGSGHWEVLEKVDQFTNFSELVASLPNSNARYGTSVTQAPNRYAALVGSPGYGQDLSSLQLPPGAVFTYSLGESSSYVRNVVLEFSAVDVAGFGNSVDIGNKTWAVAGASASRGYSGYGLVLYLIPSTTTWVQSQVLVAPDQNFGPTQFADQVAISFDERWMYVSAPFTDDGGRVYAYGRVDIETQEVLYTGDGSTTTFNYSDSIVIDSAEPEQLEININNFIASYPEDYSLSGGNVILTTAPADGSRVLISRRQETQLDSKIYVDIPASSNTGSGTGALFTVDRVRGVYTVSVVNPGENYQVGDILTIDASVVGGGTSPANDIVITISDVDQTGGIILNSGDVSGQGVSNTSVFQLNQFLYTADNIYSFTVLVDGELKRPHLDYEFNSDSSDLTQDLEFLPGSIPGEGAIIIVTAGTYWQYIATLPTSGLSPDAKFGASLAVTSDGRQIAVGCPNDDAPLLDNAGSTYVYDRSVIRYLVDDTDQTTYAIPGSFSEPVAVLLNGQFLTNSAQFINGQYSIVGGNIELDSSVSLTLGDIIEIETNQFQLIQQLNMYTTFDEADYGASVDFCPNNCSLYIGAPLDGTVLPQAGSAERRVNQSRVYGVTTSTNANPTLVAGDTIRVNNIEIAVPAGPDNNIAGLIQAINDANIPNVIATATANATFTGNGTTKVFNIGETYSSADSYTTVVYVDNVLQTSSIDYTYNNTTQDILFVVAPVAGSSIVVTSGRMTISVKNIQAATAFDKLTVSPGLIGSAFADIGFDTYAYAQTIQSPLPLEYAHFGQKVYIDSSAVNLVVGAPNGNVYEPVTFDSGETIFDDKSTTFFTPIVNGGVVYTFDYLPSATSSMANPGKFVFGQQIYNQNIRPLDEFGAALDYTSGRLLVGSPGYDVEIAGDNYGRVSVFDNENNAAAWEIKHVQQPVVDVNLLNSIFTYDKLTSSVETFFDFINPLQGKILGVARRNIDYIGAVDPASYNVGPIHNEGNSWAQEHVGEIWWDTDTVRFLDPNQDDITYASRRWGQVFPGSRVDIYQWVASAVPPSAYTGPGIPLSNLSYTVLSQVTQAGILETLYYFWVRGITSIASGAGKTLSPTVISRYIENPRTSGIPYIAPLNSSTLAIYNAFGLISAQDTILHVEYDRQLTDANVHTEYELIADGRSDAFLSPTLYRKLQDSFCGVNTIGALVPDPTLSPAEQYGVQFRPRQSMFSNRFLALENYLTYANRILAQFPIVETRKFTLLNSAEPEPSSASGEWNKRVANLEELSYQNLSLVPVGYRYLVDYNSLQNGLWTIYEVTEDKTYDTLELVRVQNFDTRKYWDYIDWYLPGYNKTIQPIASVANYSSLSTLTLSEVPIGNSVRVNANAQGKFEIYLRTDIGWERVGLEDGTIAFKEELWDYAAGNFGFDAEVFDAQYFDQEPVIETRKIIQAINDELFIDDLLIERNRALMLMFNFIYSEFEAPEWLIKTSLIDVDHKIRALLPYQTYLQDNQDFVLDYIQEVKPYHVQIREFNLTYNGDDIYPGAMTDFDVPAFWNPTLEVPQYVSPILLPYTQSTSTVINTTSDTAPTAEIWQVTPWNEWYNNYLLGIQGVSIINAGSGYLSAPTVTVTGECVEQAEMSAIINSVGQVVGINIDNPGSGYTTTAIITITGGSGSGAIVTAQMGNDLVRSFKTVIKYDRYQYSTTIVDWESGVLYDNGTMVRYADKVWEADSQDSTGVVSQTFDPADWTEVPSGDLSGVDRTMGFYVPTVNQPGLELPLLIDGVVYPGVQVFGTDFDTTDVEAVVDAIYQSSYLDVYLGTRPTDINVDGGAYIDTYESYAPEELVPGAEFDTLDLRVYTRPGSDWEFDGHGFPEALVRFTYNSEIPTFDFSELLPFPFQVIVTNQTNNIELTNNIHYTVDWVNFVITMISGINNGDVIALQVYEPGGGNQLYKQIYSGDQVGNRLIIPVSFTELQEILIYVNGSQTTAFSYSALGDRETLITFNNTYTSTDGISLVALGPTVIDSTTEDYSWSLPVTQVINGITNILSYELSNSLEYSNPANLIVTVNGRRARTAAGIEYIADGSSAYLLPTRLGFSQSVIADSDVLVYIDDIPQTLNVDYIVEPYNPDSGHGDRRYVSFTVEPTAGSKILLAVTTQTQCYVDGTNLVFVPSGGLVPVTGDVINVTTWNDTRQQNILTQVFVGPVTGTTTVSEGYDDTLFDAAELNNTPGSFDYAESESVTINDLQLQRVPITPNRLWVTLNGLRLFFGVDFTITHSTLSLTTGILQATDVVMVSQFTDSVVPEAMTFRIFQDMRGVQATYRITDSSTTTLAQPLSSSSDIIYVTSASKLSQPDVSANIWGVITINGERIMYRYRDTALNTISGLLRGTAGTAAADHDQNSLVYDMGRGNLLPMEFQNYIVSDSSLGDGSTEIFVAPKIDLTNDDSTVSEDAVEVYVGGTRQTAGYTVSSFGPVSVMFDLAPADGVEVTILVRRGVTWYAPGVGTPSDGVALQDTNTQAARFLRGL